MIHLYPKKSGVVRHYMFISLSSFLIRSYVYYVCSNSLGVCGFITYLYFSIFFALVSSDVIQLHKRRGSNENAVSEISVSFVQVLPLFLLFCIAPVNKTRFLESYISPLILLLSLYYYFYYYTSNILSRCCNSFNFIIVKIPSESKNVISMILDWNQLLPKFRCELEIKIVRQSVALEPVIKKNIVYMVHLKISLALTPKFFLNLFFYFGRSLLLFL